MNTHTHTIIWGYNNGSVGNSILLCKHEDLNLDPQHPCKRQTQQCVCNLRDGRRGSSQSSLANQVQCQDLFSKNTAGGDRKMTNINLEPLQACVCKHTQNSHKYTGQLIQKRRKSQEDGRKNVINGK